MLEAKEFYAICKSQGIKLANRKTIYEQAQHLLYWQCRQKFEHLQGKQAHESTMTMMQQAFADAEESDIFVWLKSFLPEQEQIDKVIKAFVAGLNTRANAEVSQAEKLVRIQAEIAAYEEGFCFMCKLKVETKMLQHSSGWQNLPKSLIPDGGLVLTSCGKVLLLIEAKHCASGGSAYERWHKYHMWLDALEVKQGFRPRLLTFVTGDAKATMLQTLGFYHKQGINGISQSAKYFCFEQTSLFSEQQIQTIITEAINATYSAFQVSRKQTQVIESFDASVPFSLW